MGQASTLRLAELTGALAHSLDGSNSFRWNYPHVMGLSPTSTAGLGSGVTLTYSFLEQAPPDQQAVPGFAPLPQSYRSATRAVLEQLSRIAQVTFVEIEGNRGQLRYGLHPQPTAAGYASPASYRVSTQAGLVINLEEMAEGGDVWLNSNVSYDTPALKAGGKGFQTLLHETLHSLGLKHPFEGTQLLEPVDDHWLTTVMSYTPPEDNKRIQVSGDPVTGWSWTLEELSMGTPMLGDIAALQALYGPNRSTGAGNSTYRWELDAIRRETLWDGSGKDTIDASNQTEPCRIDLREGSLSSIGVRTDPAAIAALHRVPANFPLEHLPTGLYTGTNNLSIAFGCLIEHANGGLADDVLIGNALGNNLSGGPGADTLTGGAGKDSFVLKRLSDSLISAPDRITDYGSGDRIDAPGGQRRPDGGQWSKPVELKQLNATTLAGMALAPNGLRAFKLAGKDSVYLLIGDQKPGFQPDRDAVVELSGLADSAIGGIQVI